MRSMAYCGVVWLAIALGCDRAPNDFLLTPNQLESFELADASQGLYDWPISRSGFAVSRPPIYSSLIGIGDQPLDALDRAEVEPEEMLAGDAWATFLRAIGTNPIHPFQLKPIQLDVASIAVPKGDVCFVFSGDGERLYLSDGASITAIDLPDRWKDDVPLLGPSVDRQQQELWRWKIPSGSTGKPIRLAITACGNGVINEFDFGVRGDPAKTEENDDKKEEPKSVSRSELIVVDSTTTSRLDLDTGKVLASFPTPPGGLDYVVAASDADVVIATNPDGDVYWNDGVVGRWVSVGTKVRPASQIDGHQSVSPSRNGDAFVAMAGNAPQTVWMSAGVKTLAVDSELKLEPQVAALVWADNGRIWCNKYQLYVDQAECAVGEEVSLFKIRKEMIWRPVCVWPQRSGRYSTNTGMTVLGLRRLRDGRSMWSLWDQNSERGGNSCAINLCDDAMLEKSSLTERKRPTIAVSMDASRYAYLDPAATSPVLRVCYRNPWERTDSSQVQDWIRLRVVGTDEDRRDIDRAAAAIRALPLDLYWGRPPEELYGKFIFGYAADLLVTWHRERNRIQQLLENLKQAREQGDAAKPDLLSAIGDDYHDIASWDEPRYQELMKQHEATVAKYDEALGKFQQWRDTGSVTAELTYAANAMSMAWQSRGSGMGYQVTDKGAKDFRDYSIECEKICRKLLERPRPPMNAFDRLFDAAKGTNASHLSVKPEVRRCVQLYPECSTPHSSLGFWLLPRWGGNAGDSSSYLQAAIANVDVAMREKIFGITAIRMAENSGGNVNFFAATSLSEKRAFKGALRALDEEAVSNPHWIGPLVWVATYCNNRQVVERACDYYRETFAFPESSAYNDYPAMFARCFSDRPEPR